MAVTQRAGEGDVDNGFLDGVARDFRRMFEDSKIAAVIFTKAVVLVLLKARGG